MFMKTYKKQQLDNGITLITQQIAVSNSVHFHIGVVAGSRYEGTVNNGISHLFEHLVARTITRELRVNEWQESYILSTFDAYTNKDFTKYYFEVEKDDLSVANKLVGCIFSPSIDAESLRDEKEIIKEEIADSQDDSRDIFDNNVAKMFFGSNALGLPVLGTKRTVGAISLAELSAFQKEFYNPKNVTIVASGAFDESSLIRLLGDIAPHESPDPSRKLPQNFENKILGEHRVESGAEQTLASWLFVGGTENVYGSTVSNFFANLLYEYLNCYIRDKGFSYSLSVAIAKYRNLNVLEIDSSFSRDKGRSFIAKVGQCIENFQEGFDEDSLAVAKENAKKMVALDSDDAGNATEYLLNSTLLFGETKSAEEVVEEIDRIKLPDLDKFVDKYFAGEGSLFISRASVKR